MVYDFWGWVVKDMVGFAMFSHRLLVLGEASHQSRHDDNDAVCGEEPDDSSQQLAPG